MSKYNFWACIGNCNILNEMIIIFEFCDVGWMVQSLPLNIRKKSVHLIFTLNLGHFSKLICACKTKKLYQGDGIKGFTLYDVLHESLI